MDGSTMYPLPRKPAIVFAFAGDSTMTSGLGIYPLLRVCSGGRVALAPQAGAGAAPPAAGPAAGVPTAGVLPLPVGPDKLATLRLENAMPPSITSKATPATA